MKYSKVVIILIILLNSCFTIATLYVFFRTGNEPITLVASWFSFTTGELWLISGIKKTKIKKGELYGKDKLETEIDKP